MASRLEYVTTATTKSLNFSIRLGWVVLFHKEREYLNSYKPYPPRFFRRKTMKTIMLRLTPVEALLVRHCIKRFLANSKAGNDDRRIARKIFDRIGDAYKE